MTVPRWSGAPAQIVFEDAHLQVLFKPGGSDVLLMTFGADTGPEDTRFYAESVVARLGLNGLGFLARRDSHYPAASVRAAADAVAYTLAAFDIRMAYGSSLGAWAALKHSALLRATHVVAYCPQWSIDPAECGAQQSGYADLFRPAMAGMGIRPADLAGRITLFYDPHHPYDAYHQREIVRAAEAAGCAVSVCRTPYTGHYVALVLKGSALTAAILDACDTGRTGRLYAATAAARRASPIRRRTLLAAAALRHPVLVARAIAQLIRERQAACLNGAGWLPGLLLTLRRIDPGAAETLLTDWAACLPPPRAWLAAAASAPARAGLRTAHATVLCYSALGGCLVHVAPAALGQSGPGVAPVFVEHGQLCVAVDGRAQACLAIDEHVTELAAPGSHADCYRAVPAGGPACHLRARGHYASAEPDGTVWSNAAEPLDWEVFTAMPASEPAA